MEIVDTACHNNEDDEAEIMEIMDELEPAKMITPKKPKQKQQRLPGVKLLRRINKDRDEELYNRREESLRIREEAMRKRENNVKANQIESSLMDKLKLLRVHR
jgi:hypothetical protein